ncbi:uncharacterized protein LOC110117081 [Athalia rosae]|uniref:uncharacterized protein LOC110117081 n=1 Tax=Athalia rosae TaxID=37344 RepID=UPI00203350C7|nr:uncharacterized protein LOC110117081 [Athalia rosae]
MSIVKLFFVTSLCCTTRVSRGVNFVKSDDHSDIFLSEIRSLSELPMEKLIGIKTTFADLQDTEIQGIDNATADPDFGLNVSPDFPVALPLRRRRPNTKPARRYDDYWWEEKSKSSKISKIFQLTITALSFFAFGGYLLTLIIASIRRNNAVTAGSGNVIFLQGLQSIKRPKRSSTLDPMENDFDTEKLYKGMIMLSEGYALYN